MHTEWDQLKEELTDLRTEVRALRRQRCAGLGLAIALVVLAAAPHAVTQQSTGKEKEKDGPKDLIVKSLKVVGANGKEQLVLEPSSSGGTLQIHDATGREQIRAAAQSGAASIVVNNGAGFRSELISDAAGGRVSLSNAGQVRAQVLGERDGVGYILLGDKKGKVQRL